MATNISFCRLNQEQFLFTAGLLVKLASETTESNESAKSWDRFEGIIGSTNAKYNSHLITRRYKKLVNAVPEWAEDTRFCSHFEVRTHEPTFVSFNWRRFWPFQEQIEAKPSEFEPNVYWTTAFYPNFDPPTAISTIGDVNKALILNTEFLKDSDNFERDIPEEIRKPVREQLRFLLNASIEEKSDEQDLLKLCSVRSFYGFLGLCQCKTMPSLSLTREGHVYAQWRESADRSINVRFVNNSRVDYVVRNLPENFSATSSPKRFFRFLVSLGLDSLLNIPNTPRSA